MIDETNSITLRHSFSLNGYKASVNAIAIDGQSGVIFGITAASLITRHASSDQRSLHSLKSKIITGPSGQPIASNLLMGMPVPNIPIDENLYLQSHPLQRMAGQPVDTPKIVSDTYALLGRKLWVTSKTSQPREARLVSPDARFKIAHPETGTPTVYEGAIEIRCADEGRFVKPDDAGSLVLSQNGDWIGLVVAGVGQIAMVAPLAPWIENLALRLIERSAIKGYNKTLAGPGPTTARRPSPERTADAGRELPADIVSKARLMESTLT